MELAKQCTIEFAPNDDSFDPTPKLKSSPIPIKFISFNENDINCFYCKNPYTETLLFKQRYCKKCLFQYVNYVIDNHKYLDVLITNNNAGHSLCLCAQCVLYFKVTYFKQIINNSYRNDRLVSDIEKNCKLCGNLIYQDSGIIICSDCYKISTGWIESTLTELSIQILHLPWWDTHSLCIACCEVLLFTFDCQKWCSRCNIIYTGCRHCLTTSIIFGLTDKSQCRKCNREIFITIDFINGNNVITNNYLRSYSTYQLDFFYYNLNRRLFSLKWISYSKIRIDRKIAQGGFGIIYQAIWFKGRESLNIEYVESEIKVAVKKFPSSKNITKSFLNELKSYYQLCEDFHFIIKCHGITKDPTTDEYMIVMDYADGGNLHNYLHNNFQSITWKEKLSVLCHISNGLQVIHKINFIHRDLHSGNILLTAQGFHKFNFMHQDSRNILLAAQGSWKIGDFGLSQPAYNTTINDEIYGVIPYIAPEIFHGAKFSKASDIYSLGMIMWELTSGCKPFADVEHDISLICKIIDGKRPEITNDTPECFANLMKRCWDPNPSKRPYTSEILDTVRKFSYFASYKEHENDEHRKQFDQAEEKRLELIKSKKLGPKFTDKPHPKAIYTSRPLRSLTSKSLSINTLSFNINPDYTSKEYDLDINDIQSSSSHNKNFAIQNSSNSQHPGAIYTSRPLKSLIFKPLKELDEKSNNEEYISKEYEFDINDVQSPSSKVISTIKSQLQKNVILKN